MNEESRSRIEIRSCRREDLEEIHAIERRSFPSPWSEVFFWSCFQREPGDFLVATDGRRVLGYAVALIERSFEARRLRFRERGHLLNIAVREGERRRGIGTALIRAVIDRFKERDVPEVWLEVRSYNVGARRFYRTLGFRESGLLKSYYPNGDDAVIMKRELD